MTLSEKVKRAAHKVVEDNLRKAAVIAHDAELDFKSARLMPRAMANEVRLLAKLKEKKAEKLMRHAALIAAGHGIHTRRIPVQAKVAPVIIKKKGRGGHPGPSAVQNDTQPTDRRVSIAI
jgi:hypothetical protein